MKTVRRPWLIFGVLLTCGIIWFTVSADWPGQSWLDLAAYGVSVVAILGVLIYALGANRSGPIFWRTFRWVFIGVVTAQVLVHAIGVAKQHGYSVVGTVVFIAFVSALMGWIFALQWIAMTRLAKRDELMSALHPMAPDTQASLDIADLRLRCQPVEHDDRSS